ncbi:hypothetical protein C8R44DRAFT_879401 [Mycena epipterygia]|nr:hypothetical protein C8R44DRAFT_879401 [Mycena epipterygia]
MPIKRVDKDQPPANLEPISRIAQVKSRSRPLLDDTEATLKRQVLHRSTYSPTKDTTSIGALVLSLGLPTSLHPPPPALPPPSPLPDAYCATRARHLRETTPPPAGDPHHKHPSVRTPAHRRRSSRVHAAARGTRHAHALLPLHYPVRCPSSPSSSSIIMRARIDVDVGCPHTHCCTRPAHPHARTVVAMALECDAGHIQQAEHRHLWSLSLVAVSLRALATPHVTDRFIAFIVMHNHVVVYHGMLFLGAGLCVAYVRTSCGGSMRDKGGWKREESLISCGLSVVNPRTVDAVEVNSPRGETQPSSV